MRNKYREEGFALHSDPVVEEAKLLAAIKGMDRVRSGIYDTGRPPFESPWKPGDNPNVLCKMEQPQLADSAILDLISSKEIGELAAEATGAEMVQVWWVQLLYKPPQSNPEGPPTKVGWHQDWTYWKKAWEEGSELFTAWLALSDVREDCGPMQFVAGSHLWGELEGGDFHSQVNDLDGLCLPVEDPRVVSAILDPGGVSLHHRLTLHASGRNESSEPRRSFAIHLRTENSRLREDREGSLGDFVDDMEICPILFGRKSAHAF